MSLLRALGTWGAGLCRLAASDDFACYREQGLQNAIITDLYLDSSGHLWTSVDKGGLYSYRKPSEDITLVRHGLLNTRSMLSDTTRAITGDKHGNVWLMNFPCGLITITAKPLNLVNGSITPLCAQNHYPIALY